MALTRRRKLMVLLGVTLGMLCSSLDQTIIGTAMPKIISRLGGMDLYSWAFTAYMLATTASVPIFGKLSDQYGRRPFYLGGLATFMAGSFFCGLAQNMVQLIIFRGLQGLGAGTMMANSMAIVGDIYPPAERGRWQGVMGAVFGFSSIVGPTLGGYLTDAFSWRWVFFVNLPVGLLAFAVLYAALPALRREAGEKPRVDYAGAAALVAGTVPLLLAFSWAGQTYPWDSPGIIGLLALAAAALGLFTWLEGRAAEPILPLTLFRNSIFSISSLIVFLTGIGMFGAIMYIPLFVQGVIGTSATSSGLILVPMNLGMILASTASGQLISRQGRYRRLALAGLALMTAGMVLLSTMGVGTPHLVAVRNMIITGAGLGVTMPLFVIAVQNAFPQRQLGAVTASIQFFRSIGGTVGVAVMGTFMSARLAREMGGLIPPEARQVLPGQVLESLANPQLLLNPDALQKLQAGLDPRGKMLLARMLAELRAALALALHDVFLFGAAVLSLSFLLAWFLREIPLRGRETREERQVQAAPGAPRQ